MRPRNSQHVVERSISTNRTAKDDTVLPSAAADQFKLAIPPATPGVAPKCSSETDMKSTINMMTSGATAGSYQSSSTVFVLQFCF
jgi:hypothetical protein